MFFLLIRLKKFLKNKGGKALKFIRDARQSCQL
jgi:hypothetical protein